jgi:DNA processing protein
LTARAEYDADGFTRMIESSGVRILAMGDADFPAMLAPLPNTPAILYMRGSLPDMPMIAVVGSRKPTDYSGRILRQWIPAFVAD